MEQKTYTVCRVLLSDLYSYLASRRIATNETASHISEYNEESRKQGDNIVQTGGHNPYKHALGMFHTFAT